MEKLEHPLWIVEIVNALLGPLVLEAGEAVGYHFLKPAEPIPPFMVMVLLIVAVMTVLSLFVRSRLSVENPGKLQIVLEDGLKAVLDLLEQWIGPKGHRFLPLIAHARRVHPARQLHGAHPRVDGADEQHQRDAGLRDHDVGVLPLSGHPRERDREVHGPLLGATRRAVVDRLHHVPDRDHQPHVAHACRCRCGCSATSSAKSSSS